jgi:hypothetical protein
MATGSRSQLKRKPLLVALAVLGFAAGLWFTTRTAIVGYLERRETCAALRDGSPLVRAISFTDPTRPGLADQAMYSLDVSGYCYHVECTLDLREAPEQLDGWLDSRLKCRGSSITFRTTETTVDGFLVPRALRTLHVRLHRNGLQIFDDTLGRHPCPYGFCIIDASR